MRFAVVLLTVLSIFAIACDSDSNNATAQTGRPPVDVVVAFPNLSFTQPLYLTHAKDGSSRLFVVEQPGVIKTFENAPDEANATVFLDIRDRIDSRGWEEGLLGLAFHPDYSANGYFYVNYTATDPDRTVVARYSVNPNDPTTADPNSELVILEFSQPFSNHNGGDIKFGPDGYLYITAGDGGSGGDPHDNGQDRSTLLGTIMRIDVDNPTAGRNYGIPDDNPFVGNDSGWREEIYAYGLRNVWRFSFDEPTGRLWAADVGQDAVEEVDTIFAGGNYGWNIMEGSECFEPKTGCDQSGLEMPVAEYKHPVGGSITGGHVYRGSAVPALVGKYIFADFMSGRIWTLTESNDDWIMSAPLEPELPVASFGVDANDELYLCVFDGKIYKFQAE